MSDDIEEIEKAFLSRDEYFTEICREERQFALFLYNQLEKVRRNEIKQEQIEKIEHLRKILKDVKTIYFVTYEASFMRDIFHRCSDEGKEYFNTELIKYAAQKIDSKIPLNDVTLTGLTGLSKKECKYNFGGKVNLSPKVFKNDKNDDNTKLAYLVRWMMNAKPDIGIVYDNEKGKQDIKFIECKYESGESNYSVKLDKNSKETKWSKSQTQIQEYIREFLMDFLEFPKSEKPEPVIKIKFKHKNDTQKGNFDVFIDIEDWLKTLD